MIWELHGTRFTGKFHRYKDGRPVTQPTNALNAGSSGSGATRFGWGDELSIVEMRDRIGDDNDNDVLCHDYISRLLEHVRCTIPWRWPGGANEYPVSP